MAHCRKPGCKFAAWHGHLCYGNWRETQGFVFDPQRKEFAKVT